MFTTRWNTLLVVCPWITAEAAGHVSATAAVGGLKVHTIKVYLETRSNKLTGLQ